MCFHFHDIDEIAAVQSIYFKQLNKMLFFFLWTTQNNVFIDFIVENRRLLTAKSCEALQRQERIITHT